MLGSSYYPVLGSSYSDEALTEEAVNDRLGDMLRDGRILDEFIEEHRQERGLLQRMWEGVKTLARKLTGAEKRAAQSAEANLRAALDAAATAAARQESSESRVQSSEGTENAAPEGGELSLKDAQRIGFDQLIDQYYNKTIKRDNPIFIGKQTVTSVLFSSDAPLIITGSDLTKSTREKRGSRSAHAVPEPVVRKLPKNIAASSMGYQSNRDGVPSFTIITFDPESNVLYAVGGVLNETYEGQTVNRVKTIYPLDTPVNYLQSEKRTLITNDKSNAKTVLEKAGIQSPALQNILDAMQTVPQDGGGVKSEFSLKDMKVYNRTAILNENTLDIYLRDYASKSSPNYAQAYIARMSPAEFVALTASRAGRQIIEQQTGELNMDELRKANVSQPIQLRIDTETGEINGHEGRHRATALSRAGVKSIPVLLFDSGNKYSKEALDSLVLHGQDFGNSRSYAEVTVADVQPLSYANRETLVQKFTTQPVEERIAEDYGRETVRYSLKEPDAATVAELRRENERLRARVEYWRGQTKQTRGLNLRSGDLSRLTGQLVKDYGAELDEGQTAALEESLRRLGRIMREDPKGLQYSEMLAGAEEVARELVQNARELVNDDEYQDYRDFRKWLRGQKLTISRSDAAGIADFNDHCLACVGPLSF